jgi:fucose 4-O-acetylase-like acetyltransferase
MNLNALKGILILLVILDHNDFSRSLMAGFLYGFGFHVVGFMTIPFLKPAPALDRNFGNYVFRQYWPFFVVVSLTALAVLVTTQVPAWTQLRLWGLSLYSGNSAVLKETTHMALLWFLPSFISMVAVRAAIEHAGTAGKAAIALLCVAHLFIGAYAGSIQDYLPLGLLPALYVIPLGYLGVWVHRRLLGRIPAVFALLLAVAIYAAVKHLQMRAHFYNEVGFAEVADYRHPFALLVNDLEAVTGVLMLFQLCRLRIAAVFDAFGRYSMQIYLFHAFIALAVYKTVLKAAPGAPLAAQFGVSLAATALLALAFARWMAAQPLAQRFIFPRNLQALRGRRDSVCEPAPLLAPTQSNRM